MAQHQNLIKIEPTPPDGGSCFFCTFDAPREDVVSFELIAPSGYSWQLRMCKPHRMHLGICLLEYEGIKEGLDAYLAGDKGRPWEDIKRELGIGDTEAEPNSA